MMNNRGIYNILCHRAKFPPPPTEQNGFYLFFLRIIVKKFTFFGKLPAVSGLGSCSGTRRPCLLDWGGGLVRVYIPLNNKTEYPANLNLIKCLPKTLCRSHKKAISPS